MSVDDLLASLQHDHVGTAAMLDEASETFAAFEAGTLDASATHERLGEALIGLRDHLLEHFATEEEALLPLAATSSVELRREIEALKAAHDAICALAVRLGNWAESQAPQASADVEQAHAAFRELVARHDAHDPAERALLEALSTARRGAPRPK